MTQDSITDGIKRLAKKHDAKLTVDKAYDGSYIDYILDNGSVDIYVVAVLKNDRYVLNGLESSLLPREIYFDFITNEDFSEIQRSQEILTNIERIFSRQIEFSPAPTFFHKDNGYIKLSIDGAERSVSVKRNDAWKKS